MTTTKISAEDRKTLDYIRRVGGVWTITTTPELFAAALRLRAAGLVRFEARTDRRGQPQGSDVIAV